jgi:hypothetical protein
MKAIFQRFVGIDWSGAGTASSNTPGLAVAEYSVEGTAAIKWHTKRRSREELITWLQDALHPDLPPTIVGMDFSFGFPVGTMQRIFRASSWVEMTRVLSDLNVSHGTARAVAEAINARPEFFGHGPFRTNETRNAFRFNLDSGIPYYRTVENYVPQAISGWYLGSGATVGYSMITGIAALGQLIDARKSRLCDFAVWPFEELVPGKHLLAEVYPAIWAKPVPNIENEHERDAIRIANGLAEMEIRALKLPRFASDVATREEGWILGIH